MLLLTGEFELRLDEKNRLSMPSRVREQIDPEEYGAGFYQILGANRVIWFYPEKYYQRIALADGSGKTPLDEMLAFDRVNYALAGRAELDRQGRILIAEKLIRRAGLQERVTLIGVRDHLEIWDQDRWERYLEENLAAHEEMLLLARQDELRRERQRAGL